MEEQTSEVIDLSENFSGRAIFVTFRDKNNEVIIRTVNGKDERVAFTARLFSGHEFEAGEKFVSSEEFKELLLVQFAIYIEEEGEELFKNVENVVVTWSGSGEKYGEKDIDFEFDGKAALVEFRSKSQEEINDILTKYREED